MSAAHWRNPKWHYADSKETSEPGYLARRFKRIRDEQRRIAAERTEKVAPIQQRAKAA